MRDLLARALGASLLVGAPTGLAASGSCPAIIAACPFSIDGGCAAANPNAAFLVTTYTGNLSGNTAPAPSFYAHAAGTGSGGVGGGQSWTAPHAWGWNSAGVDYPVGYDKTLTLIDPASATLPTGCAYSPTGHLGNPWVNCSTGAVNPTIQGLDFSLHNGVYLQFSSNVTGTITLNNDKFVNGSSLDTAGGLWMIFATGSAAMVFTNNLVDGAAQTFTDIIISAPISYTGPSLTVKYNTFINVGQRPVAASVCGPLDVENNYIEGIALNTVQLGGGMGTHGVHGEFAENVVFPGCVSVVQTYKFNTVVLPSSQNAESLTAPFDLTGGVSNGATIVTTIEDQNVIIDNATAVADVNGAFNPTSAAIGEMSYSNYLSMDISNNVLDLGVGQVGATFCLVSAGSLNNPVGGGNISGGTLLTLTGYPIGNMLWPSTVIAAGAPLAPFLATTSGTVNSAVEPFGTAGTNGGAPFSGSVVNGSPNLTVTAATPGQISPGQTLIGNVVNGLAVLSQTSGTTGGNGVYVMNANASLTDNNTPVNVVPATYELASASPNGSFTNGQQKITPITTFFANSGNINLQNGNAVNGINIATGQPNCQ